VEAEHAVERADEPAAPAVDLRHDAVRRIRFEQREQNATATINTTQAATSRTARREQARSPSAVARIPRAAAARRDSPLE